jgi:hypothetical protein
MWKAAYYRKHAQVFLALARVTRDDEKAAKYALIASLYLEEANRQLQATSLQPRIGATVLNPSLIGLTR